MEQRINQMIEIADYVKETQLSLQLRKMQSALENGEFLLAVMGEFSAGKSKLLNNLLGKEILPVRVTETTAIITYLQYSTDEYAELIYQDERVERITIEESKKLRQSEENDALLKQLLCIRIYVDSDLLRNGLVIADTPGVNTVLQAHVEQTVRLIESSNRILYVMGKHISKSDSEFLQQIRACNIPVMMVRTHWDQLNPDEESPETTEQKERELLSTMTEDTIFFVSNEPDSKYYSRISAQLLPYLRNTLADKAKEQLEASVDVQTRFLAKQLQANLQQRLDVLNAAEQNDSNALNAQKKMIEDKISRLQEVFDRDRERLQNRFNETKREADKSLDRIAEQAAASVTTSLASVDFQKEDALIRTEERLQQDMEKGCLRIRKQYLAYFDAFLAENKAELMGRMREIDGNVDMELNLPISLADVDAEASSLDSEIEALLTLQETLEAEIDEHKQNALEAEGQAAATQENIAEMEQAAEAIRDELKQYGDYVPQYKIKRGDHTKEKFLGRLGTVADIGTLLINPTQWANMACKVGIATAKSAASTAKIIMNVDKVADVVRGVHTVRQQYVDSVIADDNNPSRLIEDNRVYQGEEGYEALRQQVASKPPQLLDFLSLSYYFKQIGKKFDKPDTVEIDQAHERAFEAGKADIRSRMQEQAERAAAERIALLHITEAAEKERVLSAEKQKRLTEAEREIRDLQNQKEKELDEARNRKFRNYYTERVQQIFQDYSQELRTETAPMLNESFARYLETASVRAAADLRRQEEALDKLTEQYQGGDADARAEEISQCKAYLGQLREIG